MTHPDLIKAIRKFLADFEMKPSTFGRLYMGDPNFVLDVEAGRKLWPDTIKRAEDAMNIARANRNETAPLSAAGG